jgi:hypothetical protein
MKQPVIAYVTPKLHYDPQTRLVVIQRRNTETGEVSMQIPSKPEMERARRALTDPVFAATQGGPGAPVEQKSARQANAAVSIDV